MPDARLGGVSPRPGAAQAERGPRQDSDGYTQPPPHRRSAPLGFALACASLFASFPALREPSDGGC